MGKSFIIVALSLLIANAPFRPSLAKGVPVVAGAHLAAPKTLAKQPAPVARCHLQKPALVMTSSTNRCRR